MKMIMAIMAATQHQTGKLPVVLWHWKLHLPRVKMPANDPSSLFPSAIIVGCETYWFCPLFRSLTLHQMHFAAGFVIFWAAQKSKTVVQEQGWWTALRSKAKHDSVAADIHRWRKLGRNVNQWNEMKWTGSTLQKIIFTLWMSRETTSQRRRTRLEFAVDTWWTCFIFKLCLCGTAQKTVVISMAPCYLCFIDGVEMNVMRRV